ncbi:TPA: Holliday junction branch migration protein RuvA [candidate division CPR2 bacterium]|uniref:Holliday junction branch migration complex subunit RuvA n=1 Tax=candidate division CPR2 bacterium GW2011_GWC1_41_48 TaxID=1618344 RepID=A0A0G0W897_UNCC2|nr:MAG: Holliday junction ATP-dependent DNA helicase RuvA [candidate division CPR2 bacterium GW2011_GWC2_39_35]KKR29265.1 MAG: Holliday junction ATP-dependent DNA helicase RuvA [candidate division CPR2 bacterium GW2011_GWD2_39_7]KKS09200.1 MAG: Holliday junction ATP-dependent DNA helicase RuvA [candidate division CPR2 bacterium GW2011_GWC1_41_48]OGB70933.1 MAG: Holliday junction DNA helicase RuvA [candidate division CPR2 bacterium GWD2_39_7]HBG81726.1 Holliday junction branch migration protein 
MISLVSGIVVYKKEGYLVVLTSGGVGYKLAVSFGVLGRAKANEEISLHTYLQVREDILALYGFETEEELALFEKIIGVSGIGPKAGLNILSALGSEKLLEAIDAGDPNLIVSVPGIGKKTAERLVLELAGKLEKISVGAGKQDDVYDALVSLGYSSKEAAEAVKKVDRGVIGTEDRIKEALKIIRG